MNYSSEKLINILIGKAIAEIILVGVISVGFYITAFPPTFNGWGEAVVSSRSISGWAVNSASPWERVEVQLFVDETFVGTQVANRSRPDVRDAGWAKDEWHGYSFQPGDLSEGLHRAQVYAVHQSGAGVRYTLQLLGDSVTFDVDANGTWRANVASIQPAKD
jgi:hypothetical protein